MSRRDDLLPVHLTVEQLAWARTIARGTARKYARRCGGGDALAEDLAQEALCEVVRDAWRYDPRTGPWRGWVGVLTARVVRRALHLALCPVSGSATRAHRWACALGAAPLEALDGHADAAPGADVALVGEAFGARVRAALGRALAGLPDATVGLALAVFLEEQAPGDVARAAGVSGARVRAAMRAALAAWRDSLEVGALRADEDEQEDDDGDDEEYEDEGPWDDDVWEGEDEDDPEDPCGGED